VTVTHNEREFLWRSGSKFVVNRYGNGTWSRTIRCSRCTDKSTSTHANWSIFIIYYKTQQSTKLKEEKLAAYRTDGRLLTSDVSANFKATWHKNQAKYKKSGPDKLWVLCPNLRMRGHLPTSTVNGEEDSLWKWPNFRLLKARELDLDLGSSHTAHRHASLVDLYLHTKFHWIRRNFLWTDGRTYGRTDIWDPLLY